MSDLLRIPLGTGDGATLIVRAEPADIVRDGPVMAGRGTDFAADLADVASCSLREALEPITRMSKETLQQLRRARPDELTIEFGVELTASAGAVLAKAEGRAHLKVTMKWGAGDSAEPDD
jgi:hypothetical protein